MPVQASLYQAKTSFFSTIRTNEQLLGDTKFGSESTRERLLSEPSILDRLRGLDSQSNATNEGNSQPEKPAVDVGTIINKFPSVPRPFPTPVYQNSTLPGIPRPDVELADPGLTDDHNELNADAIASNDIQYQDIEGDIFVDGAALTDVQQGAAGDCYFVAALASIVEHNPEMLENMITDNQNGTYTVSFGGDLGDVTVDDDFAVYQNGNTVYAGTDSGAGTELWVAIIEKAFAQANGSYEAIESGNAAVAIGQITGQTSFTSSHPSNFQPADLQASLANNQSITASSLSSNNGKKEETAFGIVTSHAYVVTDVQQNANGKWVVTVYNPWGNDGRGSVAITGADDGFIEMSYEEFSANFREVQVSNDPIG